MRARIIVFLVLSLSLTVSAVTLPKLSVQTQPAEGIGGSLLLTQPVIQVSSPSSFANQTVFATLNTGIKFDLFQNIPSSASVHAEHFEIDGRHFVAVSNHLRGIYSNQKSAIYVMDPKTFQLSLFQQIDTRGAFLFHHFTVSNGNATTHFVAVANHYDSATFSFSTNSEIWKWNGKNFTFALPIPTNGSTSFSSFILAGRTYLVSTNMRTDDSFETASKLYSFDGLSVTEVQSFSTHGALKGVPFVVDGQQMLLLLNHFDETVAPLGSYDVDVLAYRWENTTAKFVFITSGKVHGAVDASVFTSPWGETFLALSSQTQDTGSPSLNILKWSSSALSFMPNPSSANISFPSSARTSAFTVGGRQYLAVSSHGPGMGMSFASGLSLCTTMGDDSSPGSSWSTVYRFEPSGLLVPTQTLPTNYAFSLNHFAIGKRHFLLAAESRGAFSSVYQWLELEGQLLGTGLATIDATTGLARFTDIAIDKVGANYVLTFSLGTAASPLLSYPAFSNDFSVRAGVAVRLVLSNPPLARNATAGLPLPSQPSISIVDAGFNFVNATVPFTVTAVLTNSAAALTGRVSIVILPGSTSANFTDLAVLTAGVQSLTFSASGLASALSGAFDVVPGPAASLVDTTARPSNFRIRAGVSFLSVISLADSFGNVVTSNVTISVTATLSRPVGSPSSALLSGTTVAQTVSGSASFASVIDTAGNYSIIFSASGLTSYSMPVSVTFGLPARLAVTLNSNLAYGGSVFPVTPTLTLVDLTGTPVTVHDPLRCRVVSSPAGSIINGTTEVPIFGGIAAFPDIYIRTVGQYVLTYSAVNSSTITPVTTLLNVNVGPAFRLSLLAQPASAQAGAPFTVQPSIALLDAGDNTLASDTTQRNITVSLIPSATGLPVNFFNGSNTALSLNAKAVFFGLSAAKVGSYVLNFTSDGLVGVTSQVFVVLPGPPVSMIILTQPSQNVTTAVPFSVQPVVQLLDIGGNLAPGANISITVNASVSLDTPPPRSAVAMASTGIASFSGLVLGLAGPTILRFSAPGLPLILSSPIFVSPGAPYQLVEVLRPAQVSAYYPFGVQPRVGVVDRGGNPLLLSAPVVVTASLVDAAQRGATLSGTRSVMTISFGVVSIANFTDLTLDVTGDFSLLYTSPGLVSLNSTQFPVFLLRDGPVSAAKSELLGFSSASSVLNAIAGVPLSLRIQTKDAANNRRTSASDLIFAVSLTPVSPSRPVTSSILGSTIDNGDGSVNVSALATISGSFSITVASVAGVNVVGSPLSVLVVPGPVSALGSRLSAASSFVSAGSSVSVTVIAGDAFGNQINSSLSTFQVSIAQASDLTTVAVPARSASSLQPVSLLVTRAGSYAIVGTFSDVRIVASPLPLFVTPSAVSASACRFSTTVSSATAGSIVSFSVEARDQYSNTLSVSPGATFTASISGPVAAFAASTTDGNNGQILVSTTLTVSGTYSAVVRIGSVQIANGNSLSFSVLPGPVSAPACTVQVASGFSQGFSGSLRSLTPIARDAFGNALNATASSVSFTASLVSSSGSTLETRSVASSTATGWVLTRSGTYSVFLSLSGQSLRGSPLSLQVSTGFANASASDVQSVGGVINLPAFFYVQVRDAYGNPRTSQFDFTSSSGGSYVGVAGSGGVGSWSYDTTKGLFTSSITVAKAGDYNATITFPLGDTKTFLITVVSDVGNPNAANSVVSSVSQLTAGASAVVTVQLRNDRLINLISGAANGGTWGSLVGSFSGSSGTTALSGVDNKDGTYSVSLLATRSGSYTLSLTFLSVTITGSTPVSVAVVPASASGLTTVCSGQGITSGTVGKSLVFQIQPFDAYGNSITYSPSGTGLFSVGASLKSFSTSASVVYTDTLSGKYEATYQVTLSGIYAVNVLLSSAHISGSPFSVAIAASDPIAAVTSASGSGLSSADAGTVALFTVQPRDAYGNSLSQTTLQQYTLGIAGPQSTASISSVFATTPFGYSYSVTTAGTYTISVTLSGVHVPSSPFSVTVSPVSTSARTTGIVNLAPLRSAQSFVAFTVQLQAKDAYGNNRTAGGDSFTFDMGSVPLALVDTKTGIYTLSGTAASSGTYTLTGSLGGSTLSSFPITVAIQPGPPSKANCIISGAGLAGAKAGVSSTVTVRSRDAAKSVRTSGTDNFIVFLSSTSAGYVQTGCSWVSSDSRYDCVYTVTASATYSLGVYLNSVSADNLFGSLQTVVIKPGAVTAKGTNAVSSSLISGIVAGTRETTTIQSGDARGNNGLYDPFSDDVYHYTATVVSPSGSAVTSRVTNNLDATFSLVYTPTLVGTHSVTILWNGQTHISGSPFSVTVLSADIESTSCIVSGTGISSVEAGKLGSFSISTRDRYGNVAADKSLNFTAKFAKKVSAGQTGVTLPDILVRSVSGSAAFSYTAFSAGDWSVGVSSALTGNPVSGSPFTVTVNPGPVNASRCTADGGALSAGLILRSSSFSIVARDAYDNKLTANGGLSFTVTLSSGNAVTVTPSTTATGTYIASYTVQSSAKITISVNLGTDAISRSPFTATYSRDAGDIDASKSSITSPDQYSFGTSDAATSIYVQLRDASGIDVFASDVASSATVSATLAGSAVKAAVSGNTFKFDFAATVSGSYPATILVNNVVIGSGAGSFTFKVLPGATSPTVSSYTVSSSGVVAAGSEIVLLVQAKDSFGNAQVYSTSVVSESFVIAASSRSTSTSSSFTNTTSFDSVSGLHRGSLFGVTSAATYNLNANLRSAGTTSSLNAAGPTTLSVTAASANVPSFLPTSIASSYVAGSGVTFGIVARDRYLNVITGSSEPSGVSLKVVVPSVGTLTAPTPLWNGLQWSISLSPTISGSYAIVVGSGSSATALTSTISTNITIVVGPAAADPSQTLASIPTSIGVGSTNVVSLISCDVYGNKLTTGGLSFSALMRGTISSVTRFVRFDSITDNSDGTYSAVFTKARFIGNYDLSIQRFESHIHGSPFQVYVGPGPIDAAKTVISFGSTLTSATTAGVAVTFSVTAIDSFDNRRANRDDSSLFSVSVSGQGQGTLALQIDSLSLATYKGTLLLKTAGTFDVTLSLSGTSLSGTPFTTTVSPGSVSAASSDVFGNCLSPTDCAAGTTARLEVVPRDIYRNAITSALPSSVSLSSSFTQTSPAGVTSGASALVCDPTFNNAGRYTCSFLLKQVGSYTVSILLSGSSAAGTSFSFTVTSGSIDAGSSVISGNGLSGTVAGTQASLMILASDSYGNLLSVGGSTFVVQVGRLVSGVAVKLASSAVSVTDLGNGTYIGRYLTTESATYTLSVTLLGKHALGSPVSNVVVSPGPLSAATCTARGTGLVGGSAGRATAFYVKQRDSYGNVIYTQGNGFAVVATPAATVGPSFLTFDSTSGEWTVSYTFTSAVSSVQLDVSLSGTAIASSPFTNVKIVSSLGTAVASMCSFFGGAVQVAQDGTTQLVASVDSAVTFSIQAANSFGINLVGESSDPLPSDFKVFVEGPVSAVGTVAAGTTGSGSYAVSFSVSKAGSYKVLALLGSAQVATGYVTLTMLAGAASASTTTLSATTFTAVAGVETSFSMVVRDSNSNTRSTGMDVAGQLKSTVSDSSLAVSIIESLGAQPAGIIFSTKAATYTFQVTLGGTAINSASTFTVTVGAGPTVSSSCTVTPVDTAISTVAGTGTVFVVVARDSYGNARSSTDDLFRLSVAGSSTQATIDATSSGNGQYAATLTLNVAGTYTVATQRQSSGVWEDIGGSLAVKKSVTVSAAAIDALSVVASGIRDSRILDSVTICVVAFDKYGNSQSARQQASRFSAVVVGDPKANSTVFVGSSSADQACANVSSTVIGSLSVAVQLDSSKSTSAHIKGSPFAIKFSPVQAPQISSAQFSDSVAFITVTFDVATDRAGLIGKFDCSSIFTTASVALLGGSLSTSPVCTWRDDQSLDVFLASGARILPSSISTDVLTLQSSLRLMRSAKNSDYASGSVAVLVPSSPPSPSVNLAGESTLSECNGLSLDATDSSGGAGRALNYSWGLNPGVPNDVDILNYLKTQTDVKLSISAANVALWLAADTQYTFFIKVTNFLGYSAVSTKTIVRKIASVPRIYIRGSKSRSIDRLSNLRLEGFAELSSCSGSSSSASIDFSWSVISDTTFILDSRTNSSRELFVQTSSLAVGVTYTIQLKGALSSAPTVFGTDTVNLTIAAQPVRAFIAGGHRLVSTVSDVVLDASGSVDPDNVTTPWLFSWDCSDVTNPLSPVDCPNGVFTQLYSNTAKLTFASGLLPRGTYLFSLTVTKEPGPRSDSTTAKIEVVTASVPQLTIEKLSIAKVNPVDRLQLTGSASDSSEKTTSHTWSVVSGDVTSSFKILSQSDSRFLLLSENSLVGGSKYVFSFSANLVSQTGSNPTKGVSQIEVQVNQPPSGGKCSASPTTAASLTPIDFQCNPLFVDDAEDYPLSYRWDRVGGFSWPSTNAIPDSTLESWAQSLSSSSSTTYNSLSQRSASATATAKLAIPDETNANNRVLLRLCCFDKYQASACLHVLVQVTQSTLDSSSSAALLQKATGEGDSPGTMQTVLALTNSAASTVRQTIARRRLLGLDDGMEIRAFSPSLEKSMVDSLVTATSKSVVDDEFCAQALGTTGTLASNMGSVTDNGTLSNSLKALSLGNTLISATNASTGVVNQGATSIAVKGLRDILSAINTGILSNGSSQVAMALSITQKTLSNAENTLLVGMNKTIVAAGMQLVSAKIGASASAGALRLSGGNFTLPGNGSLPTNYSGESVAIRMSQFDQSINHRNAIAKVPGTAATPLISLSFGDDSGNEIAIYNISKPIQMSIQTSLPATDLALTCNFFNTTSKKYSKKGCLSLGRSNGQIGDVKCACFHLTEFAGSAEDLLPKITLIDPIAGAAVFKNISAKQIAVITVIAVLLFAFFVAIIVAELKDTKDNSLFRSNPGSYINKYEVDSQKGVVVPFSKQPFAAKTAVAIRTRHAIVRILYNRPYSNISRPQLVTAFMTYLITTLMVNALFYSSKNGSILAAIATGIWSGLITFPVTYFFHNIFAVIRRTEQRKRVAAMRATRSTIGTKASAIKPKPVTPPQETVEDKYSDGQNPKWVDKLNAIMVAQKAAHAWRAKAVKSSRGNIAYGLQRVTGELRAAEFVTNTETLEMKLPSNMQYYAYGFSFAYIGFGLYIVLLYAISFPVELSNAWLASSGISLLQSIFISDPIKILILTAIYYGVQHAVISRRRRRIEAEISAAVAARIPTKPEGYLSARTALDRETIIRSESSLQSIVPDSPPQRSFGGRFVGDASDTVSPIHLTQSPSRARGVATAHSTAEQNFFTVVSSDATIDTEFLCKRKPLTMSVGHYFHSPGNVFEFSRLDASFSGMLVGTEFKKGVLNFIASDLGTAEYNPEYWDNTRVNCSSRNLSELKLASKMISSRLPEEIKPIKGSKEMPPWVAVDIGEGRLVLPKHYSLRHGSEIMDNALSNWQLEGSLDGIAWNVLSAHKEEAPFQTSFGVQSWPLDVRKPARFFRIVLTGRNLSKNFDLCLGGFEVFGDVVILSSASEVVQELASSVVSWDSVVSPFHVDSGVAKIFPPVSCFRLLRETPLDKQDIFACIGSHNNTRPWVNPADTGEVVLSCSEALADGSLSNLISGTGGLCLSGNVANTWFKIDLGPGRSAVPLTYTLRHGFGLSTLLLRNWNFEGSMDGKDWTILRKHHNDLSLQTAYDYSSYHIVGLPKAYRFFRVIQTGLNSSRNHRLCLGGIEIFGILVVSESEGRPAIMFRTSSQSARGASPSRGPSPAALPYALPTHMEASATNLTSSAAFFGAAISSPHPVVTEEELDMFEEPQRELSKHPGPKSLMESKESLFAVMPGATDDGLTSASSSAGNLLVGVRPKDEVPVIEAPDVSGDQLSSYMMRVMAELQSEHGGIDFAMTLENLTEPPPPQPSPPPPNSRPAFTRGELNVTPPWARSKK